MSEGSEGYSAIKALTVLKGVHKRNPKQEIQSGCSRVQSVILPLKDSGTDIDEKTASLGEHYALLSEVQKATNLNSRLMISLYSVLSALSIFI